MWRSAVQICLGLHIAAGQCARGRLKPARDCYSSQGGLAQLARAPALQAGGQRFESVILHPGSRGMIPAVPVRSLTCWTSKTVETNHKECKCEIQLKVWARAAPAGSPLWGSAVCAGAVVREDNKGAWRMPWLTEAMKDAISCDNPRGGANAR